MIDEALVDLEPLVTTKVACRLVGRSRATLYRHRQDPKTGPPAPRPIPPNALSDDERAEVLAVLRSPQYCDLAVAQVWAILLDDGRYLCSISTMYRILREVGEARERRRQRTHPAKKKPELIARRPNEVWSWDITKLQGPQRGVHYELLVIIDIFSRSGNRGAALGHSHRGATERAVGHGGRKCHRPSPAATSVTSSAASAPGPPLRRTVVR